MTSLKPYLIRSIYEWIVDNDLTPHLLVDAENNHATFRLALPVVPEGIFNDVDQDAIKEKGLQVFVVGYNPNLTGGVFSEGDDRSLGWPSYLASIKTDTENQDEVIGGKLVIWAAGHRIPPTSRSVLALPAMRKLWRWNTIRARPISKL